MRRPHDDMRRIRRYPGRYSPHLIRNRGLGYMSPMCCGLHLACRTARAMARGSVRLLATSIALGLLLRLSRP